VSLLFCRATGEPNRRTSFDVRAYCSSPDPGLPSCAHLDAVVRAWAAGCNLPSIIMNPGLRRLTFTTHVTSSLGWFGAVIVFLALAVIAMTSQDERTVRGAYLVMAPAAWFVLVPLAHASLLTGIALSLGTTWGLIRHYWVVLKLGITVFCTAILLIYMGTFRQMAGVAADPGVDLALVRNASPMLHAILALVLLVVATWLGVYKPFGMTPYGMRLQIEVRQASSSIALPRPTNAALAASSTPRWAYVIGIVAVGVILLLILLHLAGGVGLHH
jgi:uncharacterized membrane protein